MTETGPSRVWTVAGGARRSRTKIVATIGPACRSEDQLVELVQAGVDVFRLNMAHGTLAEHAQTLGLVRKVSAALRQPLAVLVDLAGPKIRLGDLPGGKLECRPGSELRIVRGTIAGIQELVSDYPRLIDELHAGDTVMLSDGTVGLKVLDTAPQYARCRVEQGGMVRSRQGINLPGAKLTAPAMDEEDRRCAAWAADHEVDFVSLSFVRRGQDVRELKELLRARGSAAGVIAKIEKQEALDDLEAIVAEASGVMVARGDLGVEIDVAQMPLVQKRIVATCREHQKPVIIATQMLDSMQHTARPTRAEVTDVANAILDGGDACMLSGETAIGRYPRESVEMMNRIAVATEEYYRTIAPRQPATRAVEGLRPITSAVVHGAAHVADQLKARLLVVATHSGATALALSKQRNYVPTVGVSDQERTLRRMCLYWGVVPLPGVTAGDNRQLLAEVTDWGEADGSLQSGDHLVLVAGSGPDASGPAGSGPDGSGPDASGLDNSGLDASGLDAGGLDNSGLDNSGLDNSGLDNSGLAAGGPDGGGHNLILVHRVR